MQVTRIELPPPPEHVAECLRLIRKANGRGWIVGGAIRDLLAGRSPVDFDIASDATPELLAQILPQADLRSAALGTCRTTIGGHELVVTTLREEGGYADQRRPDEVCFVKDVALDVLRRDFTVNGLYYDPDTCELTDPLNGLADLREGLLKMIGDPAHRFHEDPLRLLRLIRFASICGFKIDPPTREAARMQAPGLKSLSPERVFTELTSAFTGEGRGHALGLMVELGYCDVILPEVSAMEGVEQPPEYHPEGDVLVHVKMVLDQCPPDDPVLAWSAVLHDVGKPPTFRVAKDRIRFDGHDTLSAKMADQILERLRAPKSLRQRVVDICLQHIRFAALPQMRPARAERWLRSPDFALHLAFHRADCLASHGKLEIYEFARNALHALQPLTEPLLHGKDVIAMGIPSGPAVGQLLRAVQSALDELPVAPTREQAMVLLRDAVDRHRQEPGDSDR